MSQAPRAMSKAASVSTLSPSVGEEQVGRGKWAGFLERNTRVLVEGPVVVEEEEEEALPPPLLLLLLKGSRPSPGREKDRRR